MGELMRKVESNSRVKTDRVGLLLRPVSKIFQAQFEYGDSRGGKAIHSLCIKLDIESRNHRNLLTLYGRDLFGEPENTHKVVKSIPTHSLYNCLNSMLHAFAFNNARDSLAASGKIIRLSSPTSTNLSGLLVAVKNDKRKELWQIVLAGNTVRKLMKHYRIPLEHKVAGGMVDMYSARRLFDHALVALLEMPIINDIGITFFLSGCIKHEDFESASKAVKYLSNPVY